MMAFDITARLRISMFGGLRLEGQHGQILLTGKRGPAIIAYLARTPGMTAPRERLADLLWSESDSQHSRNSLRQTLSLLRRDLSRAGVAILQADNDTVGLTTNAIETDVEDFEAGLAARSSQELEVAAQAYTGPFLDGFFLDSGPFDDWVASERERLQNRALESLERLARLVDSQSGLVLADRLLEMDPIREASYRLKIEILIASGQRDRAVRTYEACASMLKNEFGVGPSPETHALWQSMTSGANNGSHAIQLNSGTGAPAGQNRSRPSIKVTEFVNVTGERADDYFARGLVQDISTALSEVSDYVVLSGFPPLGTNRSGDEGRTTAPIQPLYSLSGSIQRSDNDLRVNIQLVDAANGQNVWAQKFDSRSENALDFQDRIAQSVVLAVTLELQLSNWKVRDKSPPGPPEVRRLVNEALMKYFEMTRESLPVAVELAEKALAIAPDNARAKRTLSIGITMSLAFGAFPWQAEYIGRALELAQAAVRAVPDDEIARCILSFALECSGRIDEAIFECRHAIDLNPSYPSARGDIAMLYALRGQVKEALIEARQGIRLGTHDVIDFWRHHSLVLALFADENDRQALEVARKVVRAKPDFVRGALYWAAAAAATGNGAEATRAIHHCLSQLPHLNLGNVSPGFVPRYIMDRHHTRFLSMLSIAGLPDN